MLQDAMLHKHAVCNNNSHVFSIVLVHSGSTLVHSGSTLAYM